MLLSWRSLKCRLILSRVSKFFTTFPISLSHTHKPYAHTHRRIYVAVKRLCKMQSTLNNLPQSYSIYLTRIISNYRCRRHRSAATAFYHSNHHRQHHAEDTSDPFTSAAASGSAAATAATLSLSALSLNKRYTADDGCCLLFVVLRLVKKYFFSGSI